METYGKILLIAMPIFLLLVLLEKWYGWYKGIDTVRNMDMNIRSWVTVKHVPLNWWPLTLKAWALK